MQTDLILIIIAKTICKKEKHFPGVLVNIFGDFGRTLPCLKFKPKEKATVQIPKERKLIYKPEPTHVLHFCWQIPPSFRRVVVSWAENLGCVRASCFGIDINRPSVYVLTVASCLNVVQAGPVHRTIPSLSRRQQHSRRSGIEDLPISWQTRAPAYYGRQCSPARFERDVRLSTSSQASFSEFRIFELDIMYFI